MVGDKSIEYPVILAPMAGISDLPFRQLVLGFGVGLVVSEMVASDEMVQARPGTRERAALGLGQQKTAIQLAARDPYWAGEAARMVEDLGAPLIDINMGCPSRKVVGGQSGSALMRDLELAKRLIETIVAAVNVPVTLKTRLGWDDDTLNAPELARIAQGAGVKMITIHGRTRCQFYKGAANHTAIRAVTDAVTIPVIANGDITSSESAAKALEHSGANGVMVGRGAGGTPWMPAIIGHKVFGGPKPIIPKGNALVDMVAQHYQSSLAFYGTKMGQKVIRKHLVWYMDQAGTPSQLRREVLTASSPKILLSLLPDAIDRKPLCQGAA